MPGRATEKNFSAELVRTEMAKMTDRVGNDTKRKGDKAGGERMGRM